MLWEWKKSIAQTTTWQITTKNWAEISGTLHCWIPSSVVRGNRCKGTSFWLCDPAHRVNSAQLCKRNHHHVGHKENIRCSGGRASWWRATEQTCFHVTAHSFTAFLFYTLYIALCLGCKSLRKAISHRWTMCRTFPKHIHVAHVSWDTIGATEKDKASTVPWLLFYLLCIRITYAHIDWYFPQNSIRITASQPHSLHLLTLCPFLHVS